MHTYGRLCPTPQLGSFLQKPEPIRRTRPPTLSKIGFVPLKKLLPASAPPLPNWLRFSSHPLGTRPNTRIALTP